MWFAYSILTSVSLCLLLKLFNTEIYALLLLIKRLLYWTLCHAAFTQAKSFCFITRTTIVFMWAWTVVDATDISTAYEDEVLFVSRVILSYIGVMPLQRRFGSIPYLYCKLCVITAMRHLWMDLLLHSYCKLWTNYAVVPVLVIWSTKYAYVIL